LKYAQQYTITLKDSLSFGKNQQFSQQNTRNPELHLANITKHPENVLEKINRKRGLINH